MSNSTLFFYLGKGIRSLRETGLRITWVKAKRLVLRWIRLWSGTYFSSYTPAMLAAQRQTRFDRAVSFSIAVPLYNTPKKYLREMIRSVQEQTYGDWELCLADGSDEAHSDVARICRAYAEKDSRIVYRKLEKNLGISGNTNACLDMATGDYIALLDHDDVLHPAALYEVMRAICEKNADFIYTDENTFHHTPKNAFSPHFKPDYAPDTLRSFNYICHFTVFRRALLEKTGVFRSEFDGSQDHDMILRLTEQAQHIVHIPIFLYYWRIHKKSASSELSEKPQVVEAGRRAVSEHLKRVGLRGTVEDSAILSTYHIQYEIAGQPLVSILIPNKDHISDLDKCIRSIIGKSTYPNWEIIIIENNSTEAATFDYYKKLSAEDSRIRTVFWDGEFNYSDINNFGAQFAQGEHLLLLNNDTEVITPDWIEQMLMFSQRTDVGAVGAMLYFPDDTVQHAGVILGISGMSGHSHKHLPRGGRGYFGRASIAQELSAVTAACCMIRREVWEQVGGLDTAFKVAFNDVDLCMRIRQAGYRVIWTPYAELYHYESKSRGYEDTPEKQARFKEEAHRFRSRWTAELAAGDPCYNPNLTLRREDFSFKDPDE